MGSVTRFARDAVLRFRLGFTVSDAQQRVPAIEFSHSIRGGGEAAGAGSSEPPQPTLAPPALASPMEGT